MDSEQPENKIDLSKICPDLQQLLSNADPKEISELMSKIKKAGAFTENELKILAGENVPQSMTDSEFLRKLEKMRQKLKK